MALDARPRDTARLIAGCAPEPEAYDADIVILSFNRPSQTAQAIASAMAQRGGSFHISVLDQSSDPEDAAELARGLHGRRNMALYRLEKNAGVADGRNIASALGHGALIIGLDNDAEFEGPWIAHRAVRKMREQPDIAALGFAILQPDRTSPDLASWGYPARLLPRYRGAFDATTFVGAGHAIRRSAWIAAGGYDASLFFTWEEYDFALRAIALNWRIRYEGALAVIHHTAPQSRLDWQAERTTLFVRNRLIIERKWGRPLWSLMPRMLGYLGQALLAGTARAAFAGIVQACRASVAAPRKMPTHARLYLQAHDARYRGSWADRFRNEGLRLPRRAQIPTI